MDRARAVKPVFPFCPFAAQPGHLQTCTGYLQIELDLMIPTVSKDPDFHFRIGRKIRKTKKPEKSKFEFDQPSANYCCWSYLSTLFRFSRFSLGSIFLLPANFSYFLANFSLTQDPEKNSRFLFVGLCLRDPQKSFLRVSETHKKVFLRVSETHKKISRILFTGLQDLQKDF